MKGYIFSLSEKDFLTGTTIDPLAILGRGVFGVWQPLPGVVRDRTTGEDRNREWNPPKWSSPMLATFADYSTMRPGDSIFFFQDRIIYGIGTIAPLHDSLAGAWLNYPNSHRSNVPQPNGAVLQAGQEWYRARVIVPYVPDPFFFSHGVDMDEVLSYPGAEQAWGLRFWQDKSFQQLGESETRILREVFLRRFRQSDSLPNIDRANHLATLRTSISPESSFRINRIPRDDSADYSEGGKIRNEELLHGLIAERVLDFAGRSPEVLSIPWVKSVFHEVPASPPKVPKWADHMDLLITESFPKTDETAHFNIIEAKCGAFPGGYERTITQLMKYVDFVAENYAGGNYGAVSAYYIAHRFGPRIPSMHATATAGNQTNSFCTRRYVLNPREPQPTRFWNDIRLVSYSWDSVNNRLNLSAV